MKFSKVYLKGFYEKFTSVLVPAKVQLRNLKRFPLRSCFLEINYFSYQQKFDIMYETNGY